jgi:hypothetical protein
LCAVLISEFAFTAFSGIIATILGKTATLIKVAGRERRVHHSKSLPLLSNEERFFLAAPNPRESTFRIQIFVLKTLRYTFFSTFGQQDGYPAFFTVVRSGDGATPIPDRWLPKWKSR